MSAHDKLERQLRASVRRAAPAPTTRGRRPWSWSRSLSGLILALSSASVLVVAAVALVLLHHGRSPSPTPTPPATTHHHSKFGPPPKDPGPIPGNVADGVVAAAWNTAAREDPACRPAGGQGPGSGVTNATPSSAMLSTLPELRRPATSADHLPANLYRRVGGQRKLLVGQGGDVYIRYIRRVRVADGRTYYLTPVANLGRPPLSAAAANRCYRLEVAALRAALPRVPSAQRAPTRRYGDAEFALGRYNLETSTVHEGVSLFAANANGGGGGGSAQSLESIQQGGPLGGGGGGNPPTPIVMDGIVPSGVATVTLQFPATHHGSRQLPALNATGKVVNNVFIIPIPTLFQRGGWPSTAIWRSADGTIIKTVNERPYHP